MCSLSFFVFRCVDLETARRDWVFPSKSPENRICLAKKQTFSKDFLDARIWRHTQDNNPMNESNVTIYVYLYIYINCFYYIHSSCMYVCNYSASSLDGAKRSQKICGQRKSPH